MATIKEHSADCNEFLGKEVRLVHEFLDQYASLFPVNFFYDYHRTFLHNSYGMSVMYAAFGEIGWKAAMLHLTRDFVEATISHWSLETMIKDFPKRLMWFNTLTHNFEPQPHMIRGWAGKSLVLLATE